jgi:hypothetical protein
VMDLTSSVVLQMGLEEEILIQYINTMNDV